MNRDQAPKFDDLTVEFGRSTPDCYGGSKFNDMLVFIAGSVFDISDSHHIVKIGEGYPVRHRIIGKPDSQRIIRLSVRLIIKRLERSSS